MKWAYKTWWLSFNSMSHVMCIKHEKLNYKYIFGNTALEWVTIEQDIGLNATRHQVITRAHVDPDLCRHMAPLGICIEVLFLEYGFMSRIENWQERWCHYIPNICSSLCNSMNNWILNKLTKLSGGVATNARLGKHSSLGIVSCVCH